MSTSNRTTDAIRTATPVIIIGYVAVTVFVVPWLARSGSESLASIVDVVALAVLLAAAVVSLVDLVRWMRSR